MGLNIAYSYANKRNAERAALDPKRNQTTRLCFYAEQLYTRVCILETILLQVKKQTDRYDFESDVIGSDRDGGSVNGECEGFAGSDSFSGATAEGSAGAAGTAG